MPIKDGTVHMKPDSEIVYCEQEPLIVTGTVRSNILFGLPFESEWYKTVCRACCLMNDFKTMTDGDKTELGEMGSNLSGGQKARISLARAMYRKNAKIVLIDASLSALDAKVSA